MDSPSTLTNLCSVVMHNISRDGPGLTQGLAGLGG